MAIILLCVLSVSYPLFHQGFSQGHDWLLEFVRISEYAHSLGQGGFPVRWAPDLEGGYGSPIFIFFPPLPLFISSALVLAGMSVISSVKLMIFGFFVIGGVGMYLFAKDLFGRTGGLMSACLYVLSPYHFFDVYARNAFSEFTALSIVPFVFYGITGILRNGSKARFASFVLICSGTAFILAHNLSVIMYGPVALLYIAAILSDSGCRRNARYLVLPAAVVVSLSSFYALPMVYEKAFVQLRFLTVGKFEYFRNFVRPGQFVSVSDAFSQTPVSVVLIVLISSVLFMRRRSLDRSTLAVLVVFSLLLAMYIFMMTGASLFVWQKISFLKMLQFPWRLLSPAVFLLTVMSGSIPLLFGAKRPATAVSVCIPIIAVAVFLFLQYRPNAIPYVDIPDETITPRMIKWKNLRATVSFEYLPVWIKSPPPVPLVERLVSSGPEDRIEEISIATTSMEFVAEVHSEATMTLRLFYFPGWTILIDGRPAAISVTDQGLMSFRLAPGRHHVSAVFRNTPVRLAGNVLSLFGLAGLAAFTAFQIRRGRELA